MSGEDWRYRLYNVVCVISSGITWEMLTYLPLVKSRLNCCNSVVYIPRNFYACNCKASLVFSLLCLSTISETYHFHRCNQYYGGFPHKWLGNFDRLILVFFLFAQILYSLAHYLKSYMFTMRPTVLCAPTSPATC